MLQPQTTLVSMLIPSALGGITSIHEWSQDDRMTRAYLVLDSKVGVNRQTRFRYDAMGRRILRQDNDTTWTRYFYDGLNVLLERETKTDPVGWESATRDDFENGLTSNWRVLGGTTLTNEFTQQRRSRVLRTSTANADAMSAAMGDGNQFFNNSPQSEWNAARQSLTWAVQRAEAGNWTARVFGTMNVAFFGVIAFQLDYESWHTNHGTVSPYIDQLYFGLGNPTGTGSTSGWQLISRDVAADVLTACGGTLIDIDGVRFMKNDMRVDDVRLGDARTTKVYTLAPSDVGGIISIRDVNPTGPNGDTWHHYDRMGNVAITTDATGQHPIETQRYQDAYGNEVGSNGQGDWAPPSFAEGYGLTTKWYDGDVEAYSNSNRWYSAELGRFLSLDRYTNLEMRYHFNYNNPTNRVDIDGNSSYKIPIDGRDYSWREIIWGIGAGQENRDIVRSCIPYATSNSRRAFPRQAGSDDMQDAMRHCLLACCMSWFMGSTQTRAGLAAHEPPIGLRDDSDHMDLHNNGVGASMGDDLRNGGNGPACCYSQCLAAVRSGVTNNNLLDVGR